MGMRDIWRISRKVGKLEIADRSVFAYLLRFSVYKNEG